MGSNHLSPGGKVIEDVMSDQDLALLNSGSFTYIHPATGTKSCLDLTFCHSEIFVDFNWAVSNESHGSDHFPVIVSPVVPHIQRKVSH